MAKSISRKKSSIFEQIKESDENGNEFWSARKLSKILDYSEFRNFIPVIERAKEACINSNQKISDHFVDVHDMVEIGSGAKRAVDDVKLSRYACYLIVQNLLKTEEDKRLFLRNELRKHNSQLAETAKGAGVIKSIDYAIFQNHGYMGLYGGLDAKAIHQKKNLKKNQQILDHMGSTELAANLFRATQTEEKIRREKIKGKSNANKTHYEVGHKVRNTIKELGGAMPEDLPTENSIKLIEKPKDKTKKEVKVKKKSKGSRR